MFIDKIRLKLIAGKGGDGVIAWLRKKYIPKGGPCGGDGGKGGDVIFVGDDNLNTLLDISLRKHYKAKNGQHGMGKNMHGKNGENITISLPLGTIIKNSETKQVIVDITKNNEKYVILKGGNGGFGNARYKTKVQTAPRIANDGQTGQELEIDLELKVLADVGLVGFPNAGKSTFISKVSNAKPKIADYPFTTLSPNLGIVRYSDFKSFVIADIPGLIEDASKGKGLGSQFLKHIERTSVLAFMLDPTQDDVYDQYKKLRKELVSHSKDILEKKSIIIITKKDVFQDKINLNKFPKNVPVHFISSVTGENSDKAILDISELIEEK